MSPVLAGADTVIRPRSDARIGAGIHGRRLVGSRHGDLGHGAAGLLQPLADAGVSVDVIVQNASSDGTTDFTFTVAQASVDRAAEVIGRDSTVQYAEVVTGSDLAKVSIVGTGMENAPGYAARMFSTLSEVGVNIDMITTSEIRITTIIDRDQVQKAVKALHDAFELEKSE